MEHDEFEKKRLSARPLNWPAGIMHDQHHTGLNTAADNRDHIQRDITFTTNEHAYA